MSSLGTPLVAFAATGNCPDGHEVRLITSGTNTAYAFGDDTDAGTVLRDAGTWSAECGQPTTDGPCEGIVVWTNSVGDWTSSPETLRLLDTYGAPVERA